MSAWNRGLRIPRREMDRVISATCATPGCPWAAHVATEVGSDKALNFVLREAAYHTTQHRHETAVSYTREIRYLPQDRP